MPDALVEAIRSGDLKQIRAALDSDPKAARHAKAMLAAAREAGLPAIQLLHKNGSDLNAMLRGYRPLHSVIQEDAHKPGVPPSKERLACLEWLLKNGADPELPAAWPPARAIIIAAFVGAREFVDALLKHGAKVDVFVHAALGDVKQVKSALKKNPKLAKARDNGALTVLQCAAGTRILPQKAVEVAQAVIETGADVRALTKSWNHEIDAAYLAASSKNLPLFTLLLEHGADPQEALTAGVWNGCFTFAEVAMEHGAKPDKALAGGQPLLNNLIRWGQVKQALWLLDRGASPNIADARGWTAVHQAASRGNENMMRAVLKAGGDRTKKDLEGATPLDIAKGMRRFKLIAALRF